MNAKELVAQMTLEEKASLCSGENFWMLKSVERLGLQSVMVTDGPHGLRKQAGAADHLGIQESVPATCFPTACATACSFDRELLEEMGRAIAEECLQEDVAVLLGPGLNIKRSPLCGRNFEYISEDPYVTGELASALVKGVQSQGVGTSAKHYAANNQETGRMTADSVVDERALREIYLAGFERLVKKEQPWTIMCSYNKLDGVYLSDNKRLLSDILRDEWGFEGLVVTDWGAMNDRVLGMRAGCDLEMPASGGENDKKIVEAVKRGELDEKQVDIVAERVVELILKSTAAKKAGFRYDAEAHHALARKIAAESCVLLKNEGNALPLTGKENVAVIGAFAKKPRYQGAGSSKINPPRMDSACDTLAGLGVEYKYAEGYSLKRHAAPDETLIAAACEAAKEKGIVLLFAGLPDEFESEGFDRETLSLPASHDRLIEAVAAVNPNVIVILQCGAPVVMPWANKVRGILLAYLGGQAGGSGSVDVLLGKVNPGGKLAESFPLSLEDTPCFNYFPGGGKTAEYRESVFVGYRYYDAVQKAVAYPFGYGLSYTEFEYSDLKLGATDFAAGQKLAVSCKITNTGKRAGAEIAQLYVACKLSKLFRAPKELKGFEKVYLEAGESRTVSFELDDRAFAYYNVPDKNWAVEGGEYAILIGASSRDIRLEGKITVTGDGRESQLENLRQKAPAYYDLPKGKLSIPDAQFEALLGKPIPPSKRAPGEPFTEYSTLGDMKDTFIGKRMIRTISQRAEQALGGGGEENDLQIMMRAMLLSMPLCRMGPMAGGSLTPLMIEGIVDMANDKFFSGLRKLRKGKAK